MRNIYVLSGRLKDDNLLRISVISSIVICLMAHAYAYFNASFCLDRYYWIGYYDFRYNTGVPMGKWFGHYLGAMNLNAYVPWLNGILTIFCIAVSVYCICTVLHFKHSISIWLVAGLIAVDGSVINAHFYFPQGFMFALLFACISIWFWNNEKLAIWIRIIGGAFCIAFSLGTYGSYTSVAPTVVVLACMVMLINGEQVTRVFRRGIEYICTFLSGMAIYYLILRILLVADNVTMLEYNNEDRLVKGASIREILHFIDVAYKNAILTYIGDYRGGYATMPQWMAISMIILGTMLLFALIYKNKAMLNDKRSYLLLVALIVLFPLSAGSIYVMAFGLAHGLMKFTFVIFYIGLVKLVEMVSDSDRFTGRYGMMTSGASFVVMIFTVFIVYKGVLTANMAYSRLDNLYEISNGIALRVVERVESCEGFRGDEDVYFVGDVTQSNYFSNSRYYYSDSLDILDGILGVGKERANVFLYPSHLIMLIKENTEINLEFGYYDYDEYTDIEKKVIDDMTIFPADGSVRKVGNDIIVKFTEVN